MKDFLMKNSCIDSAIHGRNSNGLKAKKYEAPSIEAITIAPTCMLGESKTEGNLIDPRDPANTITDVNDGSRPNFTGEIGTPSGRRYLERF